MLKIFRISYRSWWLGRAFAHVCDSRQIPGRQVLIERFMQEHSRRVMTSTTSFLAV